LRRWDEITAGRVDYYIAISGEVKRRIRKYYRRDSTIIHPPVDTSRFTVGTKDGGYFLILSRLLPYKRIDIAIEACNRLRLPLKIVGNGRDLERLRKIAGPTIEFLGRLPDGEMQRCLRECRALLFPGLEDFGLAPLEAMACGKPVIAYAGGGALETVRDGVTGTFFYEQTPDSVADAVSGFDAGVYDPQEIRRHSELFDASVFKDLIFRFVTETYDVYRSSPLLTPDERFGILARVDDHIYRPDGDRARETADGR
jgi:glycosyltransferase involved in cell wall biosynthesis